MKQNNFVTIALAAFASLAISSVAHAQSFDTWDGGATDDNFGSGNNWVDNTAPGVGNWILIFQGSTRNTPYNNYTNWDDFREWRFNTSTNFTINGNPIDIGSGGTGKFEVLAGSGGTHTINIGGIGMLQNTEANPVGGNLVFGAGATIFTNGHNLSVWGNNGHTVTFNNSIQGGGSFTLQQNSTAIFNGANTYTGATTINAGTLQLGANDRIDNASAVIINGGTLNMSTFNDTVASVTLQSGTINGTGTLTSNATFIMQNGTANAGLGGSVGLNKTTNNTVVIGGTTANTYTGATAVLDGTLALNKSGAGLNNALGTNANVFVGDTGGTNPATLRLDASNQIGDSQNLYIRAGGVLNVQTYTDTFNTLNFSNANSTNTTAPVVNGTGTITLAATTNTIVREDFTQNIGGTTVINPNVTFSGATAQIVNNDIEVGPGNVTGNIVFNGNVSGNNKTIQILGNGSDNANVVWSGNQSGLTSSTVIIGESTTSTDTRQGRLIMTSQDAIPHHTTTFVLERGSLQFNNTGTLSSSNNIVVRDNAPIPNTNLSIQGPQFHGAYSYIEAQTGGSELNLYGNITVENSAVTPNTNGWKHKLQFVDSFGTNESIIHLRGNNDFKGIESSIITGQLRFEDQAAVGSTPAQQMSNLTIGQNIVSNSTGGGTPGLNYGNDTGVIVNGSATLSAHLHIAQNQATTGGSNTGNRYIGTTDTTGTTTFSGSITFGVQVIDTSNSSTVAPNGNTTLDVRAPGTSTVVLSGTIGERSGFSGTSTLLINPVPGSGSHPHAGYTAPNNTPSGLSGTVRLDQAANSNAAAPDRIWIDGGTLLKTQHNQIGDNTAMVLSGGTFATGGFNEGTATTAGMGALTLDANSTLDMGNGASFVHWNGYTNFAGNTNTLTINNYTGVPHVGNTNTDRIYFSGTPGGFSAGEYYDTRFVFTGFASGYKIIQHSGTLWEVVPIPEPSTYAAIILIILGIAYRERRRIRLAWAKIVK